PGNVRELAAVIDRAALLGNGRCLEVATALGATPAPAGAAVPLPAAPAPPARSQPGAVPTGQNTGEVVSLDSAMRAHIESALRASLGRIEGPFGAAARLRINPNTLRSRMRKLNIKRADFRATRTESDV